MLHLNLWKGRGWDIPVVALELENLLVIVNLTRPIDGVMKINSALQEIKETCFNLPAAH